MNAAVGTALVHSLWQEAVLALMLGGVLLLLRQRTANARYLACGVVLALMIALPIATAALAYARVTPQASRGAAIDRAATVHGSGDVRTPAPQGPSSPDAWTGWTALAHAWSVRAWAVGVLLVSLRFVPAGVHLGRLRRFSEPADAAIAATAARLAARIGVRRAVSVRVSRLTQTPSTFGWLRPLILLPPATVLGISPEQLQALLVHELAHIRRQDYLVNVLQMVAETVLFYHPAVWWASRRMRIERELCCDDIAVQVCGDPVEYARALSTVAQRGGAMPRPAVGSADGGLLRRVERLLGVQSHTPAISPAGALATSVTLVAMMFAGAGAQGRVPGRAGESSSESGGVLRGRVVDARTGSALAGATVRAQYVTGIERPTRCPIGDCEDVFDPTIGRIPVYRDVTDADGHFEIREVRPGEYLVAAAAAGYVQRYAGQTADDMPEVPVRIGTGATSDTIQIRLEAAGVLAGRILSDAGEALPGVEVELLRHTYRGDGAPPVAVAFAQTDDAGTFKFRDITGGQYYVRAYAPSSRRPATDAALAYLVTFLPGTADFTSAQPVLVGSGDELLGLDFPLATGKTRVVGGRLIDPAGAPLTTAAVHLLPRLGPLETLAGRAAPDGRFRLLDVPQGDYLLTISDTGGGRSWNTAVRDLSVFADLTELELVAGPTVAIDGRISAEENRPVPFALSELRIAVEQRVGQAVMIGAGFGKVADDGRFSINSGSGLVFLRVVGLPPRWFVQSVRLDGVDVTDVAFELAPGSRRLDVRLTDRVGRLSGTVVDGAGRPHPNALVIAFPADPEKWHNSQLIRTAFSHDQGLYDLSGLPVIEYRVIAVTALPRNAWTDPQVLSRLWAPGTAVSLDEVGQRSVRLEVVRPPADVAGP